MRDLGCHSGECEDCCPVGYDAQQCAQSLQMWHGDHIPLQNESASVVKVFM